MASANLFYTWGKFGGGGTKIEFLFRIAGLISGTFATFYGAFGASVLVNLGNDYYFGSGGGTGTLDGGAGILDIYSFFIASASYFLSKGTWGGGGTNMEFLFIIEGSRAGT